MLDGYIENFCYCTPYDYRNLFWKICLSLYKKEKGAVAVSIVYITIMLVLYMIPPQIDNFSAYLIGVIAAFLAMYVEDRRNIYQKIFPCNYVLFYPMVNGCNGRQT